MRRGLRDPRALLAGLLLALAAPAPGPAGAAEVPEAVLRRLASAGSRAATLGELQELIRIESISSLHEHQGEVAKAAAWVAVRMGAAGLERVQVLETAKHPVVYGEWLHAGAGAPTMLVYGHYDVQPVDPAELWAHRPFSGDVVADGGPHGNETVVLGRGANDDKGAGLVPALQGVEAVLRETGALPVNVKFMIEGMEEIGSPGLYDFMAAHKDLLACDVVVSSDGGFAFPGIPHVHLGNRGITGLEFKLVATSTDLHSGIWGGSVMNPLHAMAELIASLHRPDGSIAVEGYYDDVREVGPEERAGFAALHAVEGGPYDEAANFAEVGATGAPFGEAGWTTLERRWVRPTLEVNGMWGGFQGEGSKTVIPREAQAKLTSRLVANQDPVKATELIKAHLVKHASPHVRLEFLGGGGWSNRAYHTDRKHPWNEAVGEVLEALYGMKPVYAQSSGSIPAITWFKEILGVDTAELALGSPDELIHAPNEFFRLENFYKCQEGYARLVYKLAEKMGKKSKL